MYSVYIANFYQRININKLPHQKNDGVDNHLLTYAHVVRHFFTFVAGVQILIRFKSCLYGVMCLWFFLFISFSKMLTRADNGGSDGRRSFSCTGCVRSRITEPIKTRLNPNVNIWIIILCVLVNALALYYKYSRK